MKRSKTLVSLVIPCYNEEEALPFLYAELARVSASMPDRAFEFILVDDGSSDRTREAIVSLRARDARVRYISFSRNFGKEAALLAGLRASGGDYVAVLDADLQDPPALLPEMLAAVESGEYDCAATRRVTRKGEPPLRSLFAHAFYKLMSKISDAHIVDGARDFRLMTRQMTDAILSLAEYNRFSKGIFSWVGFRTKWLEYENVERVAGQTKWSFWKLFLYSLEGITAFSTVPLVLASVFGFVFCFAAFVLAAVVIVKTIIWGDPVAGYPSLMSVVLFIGGVQLFTIGILGQYIAKTYLEAKGRPVYIVRESSE
ncbi:MAG TPA: glycosyltransferase family 2 protein [Treponemataceae bacterium]|nr:glycosyltransferase family 2 protein [Treponemataceae bacterium]